MKKFVERQEFEQVILNLKKLIASGGGGGGTGATTFLDLTDTPSSYSSQGGKVVAVKTDESGLEFIAAGSGIGIDLTDLMLKAIYDKDSDGVVDNAKKIDGRTIYVANRPPESNEGQDGDIWIEYQE